ncbi:uncharacterized protein lratb.1 isoform X3 [Phycodurus eques]|uniref:uncharacterized protein lratb.1 isoform X3 n=1 Tax=Phycodurus eques TaxID=693459 RepID=UPI002ACDF900|nr:uncharacterized protein lratb.1 isoform X3 [Phycodurus eques]
MFACSLWRGRTLKWLTRSERRLTDTCRAAGAVRIGCASGFWGDTATSVPQLIHGGKLDFLVFDYLSEITMSLLTAAKAKAPNLGYAPDFVQAALAPSIHDIRRKGVRVVSNAGGVNPLACAAAIREVVKKADLDLKVAVVTGDDLMAHRSCLAEVKMADDGSTRALPKTLHSMNAYLGPLRGQRPCSRAAPARLWMGKRRLGPACCWKSGGPPDRVRRSEHRRDLHRLAPRPRLTGGLVAFGTAAEQLVYEIGDPRRYVLPDVICDFSRVLIQEVPGVEGGAVKVSGAKGFAPPRDYKVCATYMDGFRATAVCPLGGPRAAEKARRTAESIIKRTRRVFKHLHLEDFTAVNIQVLGAEDTYGANGSNKDAREAVLWLAVRHKDKKALEVFSREIAPAGTGMAPGLCGIVGGRPRVSPVLKPLFFYHPKSQLQLDIHVDGQWVESLSEAGPDTPEQEVPPEGAEEAPDADLPGGPHCYTLEELAYARSGDKGDSANIGVIARHAGLFPYLRKHLTCSVVEEYLAHLFPAGTHDAVTRYTLPGINGLNFVLKNSLGGGGVASLRSDPQGKALAQMLLDLKLRGLPDLAPLLG